MNENPYASPRSQGSDDRRMVWPHAALCCVNLCFGLHTGFVLMSGMAARGFGVRVNLVMLCVNFFAATISFAPVFFELKRRRRHRWDAFSSH